MRIPYVNIARQHAPLRKDLLKAAAKVIEHGQFILGPEVEKLERRFAALCGVPHALALHSGTDALVLALRALNIGGNEVITVPNSFVATTGSIILAGARPVFVDVGDDYNMNPRLIEGAITPRTRAIMPVHLTGRPADMDAINGIAARHGLFVIEDAAQAIAAEYKGRRVGSLGHIGCFSLHPLKTLNACGDGGFITTRDKEIHDKLVLMRNLGLRTRENAVLWSGHSRLDSIQAAFALVKLRYLERWTNRRRANAAFYRRNLADLKRVRVPTDKKHERAVYHTFVIEADERDELRNHLERHGVGTAVHYPVPIHLQTAAADLGYRKGDFPVAERQARTILSLPVYPELRKKDLEFVVLQVRSFYEAT